VTVEPSVRDRAARLVTEVQSGMRGYSEGDVRAVARYLADAAAGLLAEDSKSIADRIDDEADIDDSPRMRELCDSPDTIATYWDGVIQGKRRAAILAREILP